MAKSKRIECPYCHKKITVDPLLEELEKLRALFNPQAMQFDHVERNQKEQFDWVHNYNTNQRYLDRILEIERLLK